MVWYGMVWFGLVRYGLVWFGWVWMPVSWLVSSVRELAEYVMLQISTISLLLPSNFYQLAVKVNPVISVRVGQLHSYDI
jgi:hypothetical protein